MSNRRPRRSRIYDLNYNIGENYYKSAIDRLDEKDSRTSRLTRFSEPPISSPPKSRFLTQLSNDGALDEDTLDFARDRASKVIQRETILDQRTGRKALELESDFDSQVSASTKFSHSFSIAKNVLHHYMTSPAYQVAAQLRLSFIFSRTLVVRWRVDVCCDSQFRFKREIWAGTFLPLFSLAHNLALHTATHVMGWEEKFKLGGGLCVCVCDVVSSP